MGFTDKFSVGGSSIACELDHARNGSDGRDGRDRGVVILCHGRGSSRYDPLMLRLSEAITSTAPPGGSGAGGLDALRFSFTDTRSEPFSGYHREKDELAQVFRHLENDLGRRVVGIVGHSKAATDVAMFAAEKGTDWNGCIVAMSGRFDLTKGVRELIGSDTVQRILDTGVEEMVQLHPAQKPVKLSKAQIEERFSLDMNSILGSVACPLLIVHGDQDKVIPVEEASRYKLAYAQFPPAEVKIVAGADHCFSAKEKADLATQAVAEFVTNHSISISQRE